LLEKVAVDVVIAARQASRTVGTRTAEILPVEVEAIRPRTLLAVHTTPAGLESKHDVVAGRDLSDIGADAFNHAGALMSKNTR
jgi:hypothetical protein